MAWQNPREGMPITDRERAILAAMAEHGSDSKTLAAVLHVAPATVKSHKHRIASKLGICGRYDAVAAATVAVAFRTGLLNRTTVPPFAAPSDEYRAKREANPYVVRHEDGTTETRNTWLRPKTGDKQ